METSGLQLVAQELGIESVTGDDVQKRSILVARVNDLIQHQFEYLVSILYRVDVSEKKLVELLKQHPAQLAAETIVDLLLERQAEKIRSRKRSAGGPNIPEDEKW